MPKLPKNCWHGYTILLIATAMFVGHAQNSVRNGNAFLSAAASGTFFVATNGSDQWSGTLASPNPRKTDGPFASISRALAAVRQAPRMPAPAGSRPVISVRGGLYTLENPLTLKPEDSGLTLQAYGGESPVFSGGRRIAGWKQVIVSGKKLWAADIPEVRQGKWLFHELWVNGQRAVRARYPKKGYLKVAELPDKSSDWTKGHTRFRFAKGDLKAWPGATNAELIVMTRWVESRLPILSIDEQERLVTFSKRSVFELAAGDPYYLEGAFELLQEPGEWCIDPVAGTLFYLPRAGEKMNEVEAIGPVLTQVMRLEGRPEAGGFVTGVVLRGLTFSHTEWYFPSGFHSGKNKPNISPEPQPEVGGFAQAAIGVPGAVWGEGVRDCLFTNCNFSNNGNYALELGRGCQSNSIVRCQFADLGAGGLRLGETAIRDNPQEMARANEIRDCQIRDGGKMFHSAIAVWIGQSPDNQIIHNQIHDFYYTGISIGWTWGYGPALAAGNRVEFNHIHHIGIMSDGDGPILSDMGGIYTLGKQPGTVVRNNLWHDIAGIRYGGWGIYFDEGSSGIVAESNVVYRTTHGGFHQHYGETNLVRNNIFAFSRDQQLQRSRVEPHVSFSFQTNIVYFDVGALLGGTWSGDKYEMDWNIYWDTRAAANPDTLRFAGDTLEKWRQRGHDIHSLVADPLFIAPDQNDFRLKPNSPALKQGFQPIDLSTIGPRQ